MNQSLIERMRKAREVTAEALGHRFTLRIPNDGELEDLGDTLAGRRPTFRRLVQAFTVGWDLAEIDLLPGGAPDPVPFSAAAFEEWLNAHTDAVEPLFKVLSDGLEARRRQRGDDAKN